MEQALLDLTRWHSFNLVRAFGHPHARTGQPVGRWCQSGILTRHAHTRIGALSRLLASLRLESDARAGLRHRDEGGARALALCDDGKGECTRWCWCDQNGCDCDLARRFDIIILSPIVIDVKTQGTAHTEALPVQRLGVENFFLLVSF